MKSQNVKSSKIAKANQKRNSSSAGKWTFNIIAFFLVAYVANQYVLPRFIKNYDKKVSANVVDATILENGNMVIPIDSVSNNATFHNYEHNGINLEVVAVLASDGTVRTAFNTCQVCYSSGRGYYKQQGDHLVCNNCGNRFHRDNVEKTKGGCNPVPIFDEEVEMTDSKIIISAKYLSDAAQLFANWSRG